MGSYTHFLYLFLPFFLLLLLHFSFFPLFLGVGGWGRWGSGGGGVGGVCFVFCFFLLTTEMRLTRPEASHETINVDIQRGCHAACRAPRFNSSFLYSLPPLCHRRVYKTRVASSLNIARHVGYLPTLCSSFFFFSF